METGTSEAEEMLVAKSCSKMFSSKEKKRQENHICFIHYEGRKEIIITELVLCIVEVLLEETERGMTGKYLSN